MKTQIKILSGVLSIGLLAACSDSGNSRANITNENKSGTGSKATSGKLVSMKSLDGVWVNGDCKKVEDGKFQRKEFRVYNWGQEKGILFVGTATYTNEICSKKNLTAPLLEAKHFEKNGAKIFYANDFNEIPDIELDILNSKKNADTIILNKLPYSRLTKSFHENY